MGSVFAKTINDLDETAFQARYGPWDPLPGDTLTPGCELAAAAPAGRPAQRPG